MSLTSGQSLSFYEILGPLGAGGMGEVYLARDTRLEREVAIKVLPEHFADDDDRLRRFEREAKTLASLNHTNIAGIHGIDQVGDTCFLAMELVPGEDLEQRLSHGPLPLRDALDVCRQIAEGLEVAHEAGVVHRDLKPANIRITPEGGVKLLDFGLAKPLRPEGSKSGSSGAESDSFLLTSEGMVLGTPTYMSPEQARGKLVDRRTDIWAFGCVLYECLTGTRAFEGEAFGDLIAAILQHEVDFDALPAGTPPLVRRLLARTLAREPRARLRDIGEARVLLEEVLAGRAEEATLPQTVAPSVSITRLPWGIAAVALVVAGVAGARLLASAPQQAAAERQVRFTIQHPDPNASSVRNPVVAHDGSYIAYVVDEGAASRIWVRELDARVARPLPGTEGATTLFLSPDSRFIGYYAGNSKLMKIAVAGGTPVTIGNVTDNPGAAWAPDGAILYSASWTGGLVRLPAEGGAVEELTTLDAGAGETGHWWPTPLAGGRQILYTVFTADGTMNKARIEWLDLETREKHFVVDGAQPILLATGHLLWFHAGAYELAPFDARTGTLTGPPATVLDEVPPIHPAGGQLRYVSISDTGVMAWIARANTEETAPRHWYWLDRSGALEALDLPAETYESPDLSPDDRFLAVTRLVAGETDIFVHDLEAGTETRLTTESINGSPSWSPDGTRLVFTSVARGTYDIFEADPIGGRMSEPLFTTEGDVFLGGLTPDGRHLVVNISRPGTGNDIAIVDLASGEFEELVATPGEEENPRPSPDGRLVAYSSNVSGTAHVYVVSLSGSGQVIKVARGFNPEWTERGSLVFLDNAAILVADITEEDGQVRAGRPTSFVTGGLPEDVARRLTDEFAVSADGSKLIVALFDAPVRADVEVVLDAFAAFGIR